MTDVPIEKVAQLSHNDRADLFRETAANSNLTAAAVEKDFWVCWALYRLFSNDVLAKQILFKGGTSLSKCYGLIERFSEDIDLILDWTLLTDQDPYKNRSNTQQDKFNKAMEEKAQAYISGKLFEQINALMSDRCILSMAANDKPRSILMTYPRAFTPTYIKPVVELEIGPMSAMVPKKTFRIKPYCSEVAQIALGNISLNVNAIEAKKTFWDKVTILHAEAHRPADRDMLSRYSRHYYDIFQMLKSPVVRDAMNNIGLLQAVVEFKHKFYPQRWANYEAAMAGQFRLIPQAHQIESLKKDYAQMREMIFGDYPTFDNILDAIAQFERELNEIT